ncbi:Tex family protein [Anaerotalea alkaliphila]|uniref:RNA-binding transcriptional accessory protein n=1 Tax=Anaerotalea alkaliphila TaxID=2662126 RepID=A0A7X5KM71_9FIRM|nr:Tex family protein [Anaerotalea alkaliphila]NDL67636.1 RNA-binding transcriptional accessory protein [Anaerotalea alkaliphila]
MQIIDILAKEFGIGTWQVESTVALVDAGNTIPFIARYRKEATGSLSDEVLRDLEERLHYLRNLEEKKAQVAGVIREQGKLTPALERQIDQAKTLVEVEDLYRPYRPKRRTRATVAREKGLEPLARMILNQEEGDLGKKAEAFVDPAKEVGTPEEALEGALDIVAETMAEHPALRKELRGLTMEEGFLVSKAKDGKLPSTFEGYYDYRERLKSIPSHRILAVNRGEKEKFLTVKIEVDGTALLQRMHKFHPPRKGSHAGRLLEEAMEDAYKRLIAPSIEREVRSDLTEKAEDGAIKVFGKNLEQLLLQPPIPGKVVLALDPAFRTGCKVAVVDGTGKVLETGVVYPTKPVAKVAEAKAVLGRMIRTHQVDLVAIGNGTASRETEAFAAEMLKELDRRVPYVIVNEAGASVYSASKLGTEEFPEFDVSLRSAVSIGRRIQDPLAELVKIDPKSIGVGQYQHDMNQKKLSDTLHNVVEDAVNRVGVDVNTASPSLLQYVAGISKPIATTIVAFREKEGKFKDRKSLLAVPKLGAKTFQQCAGFLRIKDGGEPLDNTGVHPEAYGATRQMLKMAGIRLEGGKGIDPGALRKAAGGLDALARSIGVGIPTLEDILQELEKPGRDPREELPLPVLRTDVLSMEDLREGMVLKGTVRNIIDFGAFVDIGVHQDGLVHISQICRKFIKHPLEVLSVGDVVEVQVLAVDLGKKRISLSMLL